MLNQLIKMAENGYLPDSMVKVGIRKLCNERLMWAKEIGEEGIRKNRQEWVKILKDSPIALVPEKANEQHYELPPYFFELVLGKHLKYSSGFWNDKCNTLDQSEEDMLELSSNHADISDNHEILELGCGWGSFTFYLAKKYKNIKITAVSNSKDQRKFIQDKCNKLNINNIDVITCDMNDFTTDKKFDRVVSIEMFEHMRNYKKLLQKIGTFLNDDGKLFVHIFSHKNLVYPYEDNGPGDWMAREFFSGGIMPSHDLFSYFDDDLSILKDWKISGIHYMKTSYAWLEKMDRNKDEVLSLFNQTYGNDSSLWFYRWRIFFMACGEMFGLKDGKEWGVSHYLFGK